MDFSHTSREELLDSLRYLKIYRNAIRQIGGRASLADIVHPTTHLRVEYAPSLSRETVSQTTQDFFTRYFPDFSTRLSEIAFSEKSSLSGGARLFIGDDMIDLSFDRFVPQLMNI